MWYPGTYSASANFIYATKSSVFISIIVCVSCIYKSAHVHTLCLLLQNILYTYIDSINLYLAWCCAKSVRTQFSHNTGNCGQFIGTFHFEWIFVRISMMQFDAFEFHSKYQWLILVFIYWSDILPFYYTFFSSLSLLLLLFGVCAFKCILSVDIFLFCSLLTRVPQFLAKSS